MKFTIIAAVAVILILAGIVVYKNATESAPVPAPAPQYQQQTPPPNNQYNLRGPNP